MMRKVLSGTAAVVVGPPVEHETGPSLRRTP